MISFFFFLFAVTRRWPPGALVQRARACAVSVYSFVEQCDGDGHGSAKTYKDGYGIRTRAMVLYVNDVPEQRVQTADVARNSFFFFHFCFYNLKNEFQVDPRHELCADHPSTNNNIRRRKYQSTTIEYTRRIKFFFIFFDHSNALGTSTMRNERMTWLKSLQMSLTQIESGAGLHVIINSIHKCLKTNYRNQVALGPRALVYTTRLRFRIVDEEDRYLPSHFGFSRKSHVSAQSINRSIAISVILTVRQTHHWKGVVVVVVVRLALSLETIRKVS